MIYIVGTSVEQELYVLDPYLNGNTHETLVVALNGMIFVPSWNWSISPDSSCIPKHLTVFSKHFAFMTPISLDWAKISSALFGELRQLKFFSDWKIQMGDEKIQIGGWKGTI